MTIKIDEQDLMNRLNKIGQEFQDALAAKDAEIAQLKANQQAVQPVNNDQVQALEARLEKAKEFFRQQTQQIKELQAEVEQLRNTIPF